jgi:hypothetical protein
MNEQLLKHAYMIGFMKAFDYITLHTKVIDKKGKEIKKCTIDKIDQNLNVMDFAELQFIEYLKLIK